MVSRYLIFLNFNGMIDVQIVRHHLILVGQLVQLIELFICLILLGEEISARGLDLLVVEDLPALRQIEHSIIWKAFRVLIVYDIFYQRHSLLALARLVIISNIDRFKRHKAFRPGAVLSLLLHGVFHDWHDVFERSFSFYVGAVTLARQILTSLLFGGDDCNFVDEFFAIIWQHWSIVFARIVSFTEIGHILFLLRHQFIRGQNALEVKNQFGSHRLVHSVYKSWKHDLSQLQIYSVHAVWSLFRHDFIAFRVIEAGLDKIVASSWAGPTLVSVSSHLKSIDDVGSRCHFMLFKLCLIHILGRYGWPVIFSTLLSSC